MPPRRDAQGRFVRGSGSGSRAPRGGGSIGVTGFEPNYDGIGELLNRSETRSHLTGRAERVASAARTSAPSNSYAASVRIEQLTTDRATVGVTATVRWATVAEFRYRVLGRALDAARG